MKKVLVLLLLLLLCSLPFSVHAEDGIDSVPEIEPYAENSALEPDSGLVYDNYEYVINKYHIAIVVNENNMLNVTETITAFFNAERHGIIRKIPLQNNVVRADGTSSNVRAKISGLTATGDDAEFYKEGNYQMIKLGNANYTITGEKTYTISYTYDLGRDKGKGYDELYFNIIGDQWDTAIDNISFQVEMPKSFDTSKIGFSSGSYGTVGSSDISFFVNGNTISGEYNGYLNAYEALTIRLELPEDYFVNHFKLDALHIISIALPIMFAVISFILWLKFGKSDPVVETVEFYPPSGQNSAEVGFLYKARTDHQGIMSLLIYLANEGYLSIQETQTKTLFLKKSDFLIIKLREYAGSNHNELLFMQGLFATKNAVLISDLYDRFYVTVDRISRSISSKENKARIIAPSSNKGWLVGIMLALAYALIAVRPILDYGTDSVMLIVVFLFPAFGFMMYYLLFLKNATSSKFFAIILGLTIIGAPFILIVLPSLIFDTFYLITGLFGFICIAVMLCFLVNMKKRTPYGNEMLGKIGGFKRFLETAEKPRLEELVMQTPSYFYHILPFTYALGISDKWVKQFQYIATPPPNWYSGATAFNMYTFNNAMRSAMSTASSMRSSDSSGGSGGGGGFSGGGSGGGGGSSW